MIAIAIFVPLAVALITFVVMRDRRRFRVIATSRPPADLEAFSHDLADLNLPEEYLRIIFETFQSLASGVKQFPVQADDSLLDVYEIDDRSSPIFDRLDNVVDLVIEDILEKTHCQLNPALFPENVKLPIRHTVRDVARFVAVCHGIVPYSGLFPHA